MAYGREGVLKLLPNLPLPLLGTGSGGWGREVGAGVIKGLQTSGKEFYRIQCQRNATLSFQPSLALYKTCGDQGAVKLICQ